MIPGFVPSPLFVTVPAVLRQRLVSFLSRDEELRDYSSPLPEELLALWDHLSQIDPEIIALTEDLEKGLPVKASTEGRDEEVDFGAVALHNIIVLFYKYLVTGRAHKNLGGCIASLEKIKEETSGLLQRTKDGLRAEVTRGVEERERGATPHTINSQIEKDLDSSARGIVRVEHPNIAMVHYLLAIASKEKLAGHHEDPLIIREDLDNALAYGIDIGSALEVVRYLFGNRPALSVQQRETYHRVIDMQSANCFRCLEWVVRSRPNPTINVTKDGRFRDEASLGNVSAMRLLIKNLPPHLSLFWSRIYTKIGMDPVAFPRERAIIPIIKQRLSRCQYLPEEADYLSYQLAIQYILADNHLEAWDHLPRPNFQLFQPADWGKYFKNYNPTYWGKWFLDICAAQGLEMEGTKYLEVRESVRPEDPFTTEKLAFWKSKLVDWNTVHFTRESPTPGEISATDRSRDNIRINGLSLDQALAIPGHIKMVVLSNPGLISPTTKLILYIKKIRINAPLLNIPVSLLAEQALPEISEILAEITNGASKSRGLNIDALLKQEPTGASMVCFEQMLTVITELIHERKISAPDWEYNNILYMISGYYLRASKPTQAFKLLKKPTMLETLGEEPFKQHIQQLLFSMAIPPEPYEKELLQQYIEQLFSKAKRPIREELLQQYTEQLFSMATHPTGGEEPLKQRIKQLFSMVTPPAVKKRPEEEKQIKEPLFIIATHKKLKPNMGEFILRFINECLNGCDPRLVEIALAIQSKLAHYFDEGQLVKAITTLIGYKSPYGASRAETKYHRRFWAKFLDVENHKLGETRPMQRQQQQLPANVEEQQTQHHPVAKHVAPITLINDIGIEGVCRVNILCGPDNPYLAVLYTLVEVEHQYEWNPNLLRQLREQVEAHISGRDKETAQVAGEASEVEEEEGEEDADNDRIINALMEILERPVVVIDNKGLIQNYHNVQRLENKSRPILVCRNPGGDYSAVKLNTLVGPIDPAVLLSQLMLQTREEHALNMRMRAFQAPVSPYSAGPESGLLMPPLLQHTTSSPRPKTPSGDRRVPAKKPKRTITPPGDRPAPPSLPQDVDPGAAAPGSQLNLLLPQVPNSSYTVGAPSAPVLQATQTPQRRTMTLFLGDRIEAFSEDKIITLSKKRYRDGKKYEWFGHGFVNRELTEEFQPPTKRRKLAPKTKQASPPRDDGRPPQESVVRGGCVHSNEIRYPLFLPYGANLLPCCDDDNGMGAGRNGFESSSW